VRRQPLAGNAAADLVAVYVGVQPSSTADGAFAATALLRLGDFHECWVRLVVICR
jgi:hypothetical protein